MKLSKRSESTIAQLLSARGNYTVFAPTNDAVQHYLDSVYQTTDYDITQIPDSVADYIARNAIIDCEDLKRIPDNRLQRRHTRTYQHGRQVYHRGLRHDKRRKPGYNNKQLGTHCTSRHRGIQRIRTRGEPGAEPVASHRARTYRIGRQPEDIQRAAAPHRLGRLAQTVPRRGIRGKPPGNGPDLDGNLTLEKPRAQVLRIYRICGNRQ